MLDTEQKYCSGLYKYVHNGKIIYIGQVNRRNGDIYTRIKEHTKEPKFKMYLDSEIWFADMTEQKNLITAAELGLIDQYTPILNAQSKPDHPSNIDFEKVFNLVWKKLPTQECVNQNSLPSPSQSYHCYEKNGLYIYGKYYSKDFICTLLEEEESIRKAFAFGGTLVAAKINGEYKRVIKIQNRFGEQDAHYVERYYKNTIEKYSRIYDGDKYNFFKEYHYIPRTIMILPNVRGCITLQIEEHRIYDVKECSHIEYIEISPGAVEKFVKQVCRTIEILNYLKTITIHIA